MNILIHSDQDCRIGKLIRRKVSDEFPQIQVFQAQSIRLLLEKLSRPLHEVRAVVLVAKDRSDLIELQESKSILEDIKLLLVLPETGHDMMELGLKLHPSYICYSNSDFNDISSVIEKLQVALDKKKWRK